MKGDGKQVFESKAIFGELNISVPENAFCKNLNMFFVKKITAWFFPRDFLSPMTISLPGTVRVKERR